MAASSGSVATAKETTKEAPACEHAKLKVGEYLSSTTYMQVTGVLPNGMTVRSLKRPRDDATASVTWNGKALIETDCVSASQYAREIKVSKSECAERLTQAGHHVFTVEFEKQNGEARTLVGHFVRTEPLLGRSHVVDLETPKAELRQVDHRTIRSLILCGVKYVVK